MGVEVEREQMAKARKAEVKEGMLSKLAVTSDTGWLW